jgi:hypothetical protein
MQPGDRLVVIADIVEEALQTLHTLATDAAAATEGACRAPVTLEPAACYTADLVGADATARGHEHV